MGVGASHGATVCVCVDCYDYDTCACARMLIMVTPCVQCCDVCAAFHGLETARNYQVGGNLWETKGRFFGFMATCLHGYMPAYRRLPSERGLPSRAPVLLDI